MMITIKITDGEYQYNCPFNGSCNNCQISEDGITCPSWDEKSDTAIVPKLCPLRDDSALIEMMK